MCWTKFGKELKIANGIMNSIRHACGEIENSLWCCKMMFHIWLSMDMPQSWNNIREAITSPEISTATENEIITSEFPDIKDVDKAICGFACEIQINSIKFRHAPLTDNWPLTKPQHFTSVAIIYHKEGNKKEIVKLIAEVQQRGFTDYEEVPVSNDEIEIQTTAVGKFSNIKNHKDLSELFINDLKCVLIEGAPGIGKTTLAEEIVFQWSLGNILAKKKLILLIHLRDLICQTITSLSSLIKHCIESQTKLESTEISMIENYIIESKGDKVALILDGYDELPIKDIRSNKFFINKIIDGRVGDFTKGMVIVTSRPNISARLHKVVDYRVEILGFTEANRMEYISQALQGNEKDIKTLQSFLHKNPAINLYCYIPLNMTMLLYLFSELGCESELPTTQTEINKSFICLIISRYIQRSSQEIEFTGTNFSRIPNPYNVIFKEMAAHSFHTLQHGKIIFNKNEIEKSCPNLVFNPKTWNGLGLLNTVQLRYSMLDNTPGVLFNFLHLSIQEMLSAYHVALLPDGDQIKLLKKTFWDPKYFNMWIMYVGLTKGKSFSFMHFLSGNSFSFLTQRSIQRSQSVSISRNIISDKFKCLQLFQCFSEAEDTEMCRYVGQLLQDGNINLSEQTLNPVQINMLSIFLTQINIKHWKILNLSKCNLGDDGFSKLYASISGNSRSAIRVEAMDLSFNDLTEASANPIVNLVMTWKVESLNIASNDISFTFIVNEIITNQEFTQSSTEIIISRDNKTELIASNKAYGIITKFNMKSFSHIFFYRCNLGNNLQAINNVLSLLKSGKEVYVYDSNLPFESLIKNAKETKNTSFHYLSEVGISQNKVSETINEFIHNAKCALTFDESKLLPLHIYNVTSHNIASLEEVLFQKDICGTIIFSFDNEHEIESIFSMLQSIKSVKHFSLRRYNMETLSSSIDLVGILEQDQLICLDMSSTLISNKIKSLADALSNHASLKSLNLSNCKLQNSSISVISKALTNIKHISYLNLSNNCFNTESAKALANAIAVNKDLQYVELFNCNLNEDRIITILNDLKQNSNLLKLDLGANVITDEAVRHLAELIVNNVSINQLYLKDCGLQHIELKILTNALADSQSITEFDVSCNSFSDQNCKDIAHVIKLNRNIIRHLDFSNCEIEEEGILSVSSAVCETEGLMFLNLSGNQINDPAAGHIAAALCKSTKLEFLILSKCTLSSKGFQSITNSLKEIRNLKYLDISFIQVTDQASLDIAILIDVNSKLKHLNFSHCNLQENGLLRILNAVNKLDTLKYFNISSNSITIEVANEMATIISNNYSLEHVHISNCRFSEEGILTITREIKVLNTLDISLNTITSRAVSKLSEVITTSQLKHFNISNCYIKEKLTLFCYAITRNENLQSINFSGITMNSMEAKYLGNAIKANRLIEELILTNCNLHASGLGCIVEELKKMTGIRHLDLAGSEFDDKVTVMLAETINKNAIEHLNLSSCLQHTNVSSILIKAVANKGTFFHIDFSSNNIGNNVASILSIAISVNPNLKFINLSDNSFTDEGIKVIINGMSKINSLESVGLENYDITNKHLKRVIMSNGRLQYMKLRKLLLQNFEMKDSLYNFKGQLFLKGLCVENSKLDDNEVLIIVSILATNPDIWLFSLSDCIISTPELKMNVFNALCLLAELRHLVLNKVEVINEIEVQLVTLINGNADLKHLDISGCKLNGTILMSIFKNISRLLHLNISNGNVTAQVLAEVMCVIDNSDMASEQNSLKYINISNNPISDVGIDIFAQTLITSPSLEYLNVSNCSLQSKGINTIVKAIANLTSLKYLDLSLNDLTDEEEFNIEIAIKNNSQIECLHLPNHALTRNKLRNIFNMLQTISTLKILDINSNKIDHQLANYLAAAIRSNRNLEKLLLSGITLEEGSIIAFNYSIRILFGLKYFSAVRCIFTDQITKDITMAVFNSDKLEQFNLQFCSLSDINKASIFNSLKIIRTLKYLNISGITANLQLEDDVVVILKNNPKMEHLEIAQCNISKSGVERIIAVCSNLVYLNFSCNESLSHMGGSMATLLANNTDLKYINLSRCCLVPDDIYKIAKAMQNLSLLQCIDLSLNKISDELSNDMAVVLTYNKKLENHLKLSFTNMLHELSGEMAAVVIHTKKLEKVYFPVAKLSFRSIKIIAKAMSQVTSLTHVDLNVNKVDDSVATDIAEFMSNNKDIVEVRFSKLQLQHNGYKKLNAHLEKFKGLKHISIRNCNLSLAILTTLIFNNETINHLSLQSCNISIQKMLQLTQILRDVYSLQYLDFSYVNISDPQVVENIINVILSNTKLRCLQLAGCKLNAFHITNIVAALKLCNNLVLLNLSHNNIASLSAIKELTELLINGHIQYLYLQNCFLNLSELQDIMAALNIASTLNSNTVMPLEVLDLRLNNIQIHCSQNEIGLITTMILNRKVKQVSLPNFDALNLQLILKKLSDVNSLRYLDFGSNQITDELASKVVTLITSNYYISLKHLRISKLILNQNGLLCFSNSKLNIRGIKQLSTTSCLFNSSTWGYFTHLMVKNKNSVVELIFADCSVPKNIGEVIRHATKLQHLQLNNINVNENTQGTILTYSLADDSKIFADPLWYKRKLLHLNLSYNYLDGEAVDKLFATVANFDALEYLVLANCGLTPKQVKHLTRLNTLTKLIHLDLRCNMITDEEVRPVAELISSATQLQYINLSSCGLQFNGIYIITEVLKTNTSLEHLDLSLNGEVSYDGTRFSSVNELFEQIINVILRSSNLLYLKLPHILLSNEQLRYLLEIITYKKSFKCLDLGPNGINDKVAGDLAEVLSNNTMLWLVTNKVELEQTFSIFKHHLMTVQGLLELSINFCNLNDEDANIIISTVANNHSMQRLDLCNSKMSDKSKLKVFEMLARIGSLKYLSLNMFTCNATIATALANVIASNVQLKNIELLGCNLDKDGCNSVLSAINWCKDLALINLSYNAKIGESKFRELNVFMNNYQLTHIDVTACNFNCKTISEFCEALQNCKNLKCLNLSHNSVVREVPYNIASLLSVLTKLEYLSLYNCQLEPTGIYAIAAELKELCTLQYVYFNLNEMTHDAVDILAAVIASNKNMKKFALPNYNESYIGIEVILQAMKDISSLQYLDISCAQVFMDGAIQLAGILENNANLQKIRLRGLNLGPTGFMKVSHHLTKLRKLEYFTISLSLIDDKSVDNVAKLITNNPNLKKIDLSGCKISLQGKVHIFQALTSLNMLEYLSVNNIIIGDQLENDLIRILLKNIKLKHFEMGNCASKLSEYETFKIIESIENHKYLIHFNFNNNRLTDNNLSHLLNLIEKSKIEHLELSKCNITSLDPILKVLSLSTLQYLDISHNPISNMATTVMQHITVSHLTYLNLSQCMMPDESTANVIKCLVHCKLLTHLDLSSNLLQSSNASAIHDLVVVISSNKSIENIFLPTCTLSDLNIKAILSSTNNAKLLRIFDLNVNQVNNEIVDDIVAMMSSHGKLNQIKFSTLVVKESSLESLKLCLPKFKGLTHFSIIDCKITDENANFISLLIKNNLSIKTFKICNCSPTHAKSLQSVFIAMKYLKHLQLLHVTYNDLTIPLCKMDNLTKVITSSIGLKAIGLGGCGLTEASIIEIFKAVVYPQNITHLKLEDNSLSPSLTTTLSDLQVGSLGLEQLTLSNCKITGEELSVWQGITEMPKLRILDVSNNPINVVGAEIIQSIIINTKQLQSLNLSNCTLQFKQLDQIIRKLNDVNSLNYLNISGNSLNSDVITPKLIAVINRNTIIQHLHFSNCNLKDLVILDLLNVLKHKACVKTIDISLNLISSSFTKELIEVVTRNHNLELLMLPKLELSQHELQILSKTLPFMRKLEHLTITGATFTGIDAKNVATLIDNNKSLEYLNISGCVMSDNEKERIFRALKSITELTYLILNDIAITNQVKDEILTVIARNTKLQHIEMKGCLNAGFVRSVSSVTSSHRYIIYNNIS